MGGTFVEVDGAIGGAAVAAIVGRLVAAGGTGLAVGVIGLAHAANTITEAEKTRVKQYRMKFPRFAMDDAITFTSYSYTKSTDAM